MKSLNESAVESNKKDIKMEENKTLTGLKAKLDIFENDLNDIQDDFQNLDWKIQELSAELSNLVEIKEQLEKLSKLING